MATATHQEGSGSPSDKLEDQAATAALYVTKDTPSKQRSRGILDEDGKLSSAGAATSLKYARAQDLPSFPSTGGVKLSSAGAAASLADSKKKSFEPWKPGAIPAANQAATRAKDYEMDPLWQPGLSKAGSKAALLAHKDAHSVEIWKAPESEHGHSAAGQAFGRGSTAPNPDLRMSADSHRKALLAATGAMSGNRKRSDSAPLKTNNSNTSWALKAATSSQKNQPSAPPTEFTTGDPGFEAARVQNMAKNSVPRQMYGSKPPVAIEVEEKNRQDTLRASAVAMAQRMYAVQQSQINDAKGVQRSDSHYAANRARDRAMSDASSSVGSETKSPHRYENLEEAARRLAQERLAKLHDEHAEYRQYYGQNTSPRSRLSMRGRRRASSQGANDDSDEEQSKRIRGQMSIFHSKLAEVDGKKRQADRDALIEAAHKNVTAKMNAMDEKIFQNTGKSSPQQRELWERQARERAQRESDERMVNVGKVHIGGGKYLEQSEVEAIAKAKLQPTLDEISEKAEKQRALDEERRLDEERQKAELAKQKANESEIKAEAKRAAEKEKQEEKARKAEEKKRRQSDAAAEKERAKQEKEEKRKSRETKPSRFSALLGKGAVGAAAAGAAAPAAVAAAIDARPGTSDTNASKKSFEETSPEEDTVKKAEPAESAEPTEAVEPIEHTEAVEPIEHTETTEAAGPTEAIEPTESTELAEPAESAKPAEPAEPVKPTEPAKPIELAETAETFETVEPAGDIAEPGKAAEPAKATEPKVNEATIIPTAVTTEKQPTSPEKSDSKVKTWFKSKFRSGTKTQRENEEKTAVAENSAATQANNPNEDEKSRPDSMRDVALAGRTTTRETEDLYGGTGEPVSPVKDTSEQAGRDRSPSISPVSSIHSEEHPKESSEQRETEDIESEDRGRKGFNQRPVDNMKPSPEKADIQKEAAETPDDTNADEHNGKGLKQRIIDNLKPLPEKEELIKGAEKRNGSAKSDDEDFDEARDQFEEEKLAPPPKISSGTTGSPVGSRERSKFTEDL